jgi:hypothetical protein
MPRYRADILDSNGRFKNTIFLETHDEEAAAESAKRLAINGYDVELWDGGRKIATFKSGE